MSEISGAISGELAAEQTVDGSLANVQTATGKLTTTQTIYGSFANVRTAAGKLTTMQTVTGLLAGVHTAIGELTIVGERGTALYDGSYEVTPLAGTETILETAGRRMADDVTVREIPYHETTNESGGYTVIIG